jgi:dephospho-CoA kinase
MNAAYDSCVGSAEPLAAGVSSEAAKGAKSPLQKPLIIGVTGGMASGKSTLARMIAGRGIAHVDADALVHQLMRDDADTIAAIAKTFPAAIERHPTPPLRGSQNPFVDFGGGIAMLAVPKNPPTRFAGESGSPSRGERPLGIDRAALANHIANHPEALQALEAILHPRVRALEEAAIAFAARNRLRGLVLDVPLMFETGADELCDIVIAVHAPVSQRRARAFRRAGMTEAKWNRLVARQWPDADRNALADLVISSTIGKAAMRRRIHTLMHEWGLK